MSEEIINGMMSPESSLADELDRVYSAITEAAPENSDATTGHISVVSCRSLDLLTKLFGLSGFERDVLLLCAGAALETRFLKACAVANGDERANWPTLAMAMSLLDDAHWSVLSRLRPLRYWRLIEDGPSQSILQAPLKADERILQYLLGVPAVDAVLEWILRPMTDDLTAPQHGGLSGAAWKIAAHWASESRHGSQTVILVGKDSTSAKRVFAEACREADLLPFMLRAVDLPASTSEREITARYWTREAVLSGAALFVDAAALEGTDGYSVAAEWTRSLEIPVAIGVEPGSPLEQIAGLHVNIPALGREGRKNVWLESLGSAAAGLNGQLDRLVDGFDFDETTIRLAALDVLTPRGEVEGRAGDAVWRSCQEYARRPLQGLAQRIEPRARWEDLVLPEQQLQVLHELTMHVKHRQRVNYEWGFASRYTRGMGLSALFAGPSGTGKTMAAEVVAGELGLDLYQIDLASIVSKYIGETEKNLKRIFDAAEQSGSLLLFDEADALFGKRSEVKDSHDRYANLEVSYLLQRMEAYRGIALLTTNMQRALDPAFLRRIRFVVQFPFPNEVSRREMWTRVFPSATPTEGLQPERLAQLHVSGAVIRNIAMHAAYLAAEDNLPVKMSHIAAGVRTEYTKMDKVLTPAETGGWA